jgi:vacuolar-type H+-ATPase subunit I/STV1
VHRFQALRAGFLRAAKREFREATVKKSKSLKPLSMTFFLSGIWDIIAGFVYLLMIGTVFPEPPVHRFYALFIASFLFCFA